MRTSILVFALACKPDPPVLTSVEAAEGPTGITLTLTGTGLVSGTKVTIGGVPLRKPSLTPPTKLSGLLPSGLVPGDHPVVVTLADGQSTTSSHTVPAPTHTPCDDPVKITSHIPPTAEVIKIDQHHPEPNKRVDNIQIKAHDVVAILYGSEPMDAETTCTSIWIRARDGREHLFDADKVTDLKEQAYKIGRGMGKPVDNH
jgi:hypothetical protein